MITVRDTTGRTWQIGAVFVRFDGREIEASACSADARFDGLYCTRIRVDLGGPALPEFFHRFDAARTCPHGRESWEHACEGCPGAFTGSSYRRILEFAQRASRDTEIRDACPMPVYFDADSVCDVATHGFEEGMSGTPEQCAFADSALASAYEYGVKRGLADFERRARGAAWENGRDDDDRS